MIYHLPALPTRSGAPRPALPHRRESVREPERAGRAENRDYHLARVAAAASAPTTGSSLFRGEVVNVVAATMVLRASGNQPVGRALVHAALLPSRGSGLSKFRSTLDEGGRRALHHLCARSIKYSPRLSAALIFVNRWA